MAKKELSEAAKKRVKAGQLLLAGKRCVDVALAVGVARQTVQRWKRMLNEGGIDALLAVPERGRTGQLNEEQLAVIRTIILQSPTKHGFDTELWTVPQVGTVIERLYGVRFGQSNLWRILSGLASGSLKPAKRVIKSDKNAARSYTRSSWSILKNKLAAKTD